MKRVIDIEDLYLFVKAYEKYFLEHKGKRYFNPQSLRYAIRQLSIKKGYFIND